MNLPAVTRGASRSSKKNIVPQASRERKSGRSSLARASWENSLYANSKTNDMRARVGRLSSHVGDRRDTVELFNEHIDSVPRFIAVSNRCLYKRLTFINFKMTVDTRMGKSVRRIADPLLISSAR